MLIIGDCLAADLPISSGWSCPGCEQTSCTGSEQLEIQYLGSGGYRLSRGSDLVLLAPFFSNPGLLAAASFRSIIADTEAIDRWLPDVSTAAAILVGHAHYDHLLDIPRIAQKHAPEAIIYGSASVAHILAAIPELKSRVVVLNEQAYSPGGQEQWIRIPGTQVRFLPIVSGHAPHIAGIKFMQGRFSSDLEQLPRRAKQWKEGLTLAYLIEFLADDGVTPIFRIHYQDAVSAPPLGFPPPDKGSIDVAITCLPGHNQVQGYPQDLLNAISVRHVIMGHWEDFFRPYTQDPAQLRAVRFSKPEDFIKRVDLVLPDDGQRSLLAPGSGIRLVNCPAGS